MAFVVEDDALWTNIDLIVLTEEFGAFVGMFEAVFFGGLLLCLHLKLLLLSWDHFFRVEVVQNGEVFNQLLDIGAEIAAASWTGKNVTRSQIHETVLAESVATSQDARDLLLVIILVEADGARDFHGLTNDLVCRFDLKLGKRGADLRGWKGDTFLRVTLRKDRFKIDVYL